MASKQKYAIPEIPESLRTDALRASISAVSHVRDRAILEILAGTGLRESELTGINLSNVYSNKTVRVLGKGSKVRVVPITDEADRAITEYVAVRKAADGETALFVSGFGTRPGHRMNRRSVYNVVAGHLFYSSAHAAALRRHHDGREESTPFRHPENLRARQPVYDAALHFAQR